MRIDSERIPQHLKRGLSPLYVIFGEELLLAIEAGDRIRTAAVAAGYEERKVLVAESGFNWSELLAASSNLSLFASKRVLDLRIPSGKPGKDGAEALVALAETPPQDTVTLVSLPDLDRQAQASKWFEALEQGGVAVHAAPVGRERLPKWIANRLSLQGQRASDDTLAFIADRVEGNLMAAHQEVQKLALLLSPGELPADEVRNAVLDVARFDVFELGPALLRGERARFVRMMDGLRGEGTAAPLVLWAIAEEARAMARVHGLTARGVSLPQALREARVWGPRQQSMPKALGRLDRRSLISALARAAQVDRMIKGLRKGDVWDALLALGLSLMPSR
jgi:DNA polymerase-3 subunit delta